MRAFAGFIRKEFRHIVRDPRTLLILFGMPVIQLVLFGFAISTELRTSNLAVLDMSRDVVSGAILDRMRASEYFDIVEDVNSEEDINAAMQAGRIKLGLIFGPDFAGRFSSGDGAALRIVTDAADPNTARLLQSYATAIVRQFQQDEAGAMDTPGMRIRTTLLFNPLLQSVYMFVPGLIVVVLMLVSALMTSIAITREKELGTMEVLLVSPLRPFQIIIGKVLPYLLLSCIIAALILILSQTVFALPFNGSMLLFWVECLLFIFTSLALGIFISTVARTQQVAMMVSLAGLLMPTILLSGFIFPIENMPVPLQVIANAIPARWFLEILKGVMIKGLGIQQLWTQTAVIVFMLLLFTGLSIRKFNIRLQ